MRHLALFRGMGDGAILEIARAARFREYEKGEIVVGALEKGQGLSVLLSGRAQLLSLTRAGREVVLDAIEPGDVFGERTHLGEKPLDSCDFVLADEPCRVLTLPGEPLEALVERYPVFAMNLARCLAVKIVRMDRRYLQAEEAQSDLYEVVRQKDSEVEVPHQNLADTPFFRQHEARVTALAESGDSLLLSGEAGVGKHELARIIFRLSGRFSRIFLTANLYHGDGGSAPCAEELLFGAHGEGRTRPGLVDLSREGTLLLLGVELLPERLQERLYRLIQETRFPSAGSAGAWSPGPRLLACTVKDLPVLRREGRLLPALADYFAPRHIAIPPLRDRTRDIPVLAGFYAAKYACEIGKQVSGVSDDTLKVLLDHTWPGNETELAETIKRGVVLADRPVLQPEDIYLDFKRVEDRGKLNLLRFPGLFDALRSPYFPAGLQWAAAPFFLLLLAFLLLGSPNPDRNLGAVYSWALGWPMMVIGTFFWARFWCTLCPMGTVGALAKRLKAYRLPVPHVLKKHSQWIVMAFALGVLWLEMVAEMRLHPQRLGLLLLGMTLCSAVFSVLFERQVWCGYLCGLGGMMGFFSKLSPLELRADRNVCLARCTGHECYTGTEGREGCPFFQLAPALDSNQSCKLCTTCLKVCQHRSISLFLRLPARELWDGRQEPPAVSFFIAAMFGALLCELAVGTPAFLRLSGGSALRRALTVTAVFGGAVVLSNAVVLLASRLSAAAAEGGTVHNYALYGKAYGPLVFAGFVAYHGYYLATLGGRLPSLLAGVMGIPVLAHLALPAGGPSALALQSAAVGLGVGWALFVLFQLAKGREGASWRGLSAVAPHLLACAALGLVLARSLAFRFQGVPVPFLSP